MKSPKRHLTIQMLFVLVFSTFCLAGLSSCESINDAEEIGVDQGVNKQGEEGDSNPCAGGNLSWNLTATLLPAADYPDYDVAFRLEGSMPSIALPCHCHKSWAWVKLSTDVSPFDLIASLSSYDPGADPNIIYSTEIIDEGTGKTNSYIFNIPSGGGDIVLFNFKDGIIPTGAAIADLIDNAGGICIVDNIHDPHG